MKWREVAHEGYGWDEVIDTEDLCDPDSFSKEEIEIIYRAKADTDFLLGYYGNECYLFVDDNVGVDDYYGFAVADGDVYRYRNGGWCWMATD